MNKSIISSMSRHCLFLFLFFLINTWFASQSVFASDVEAKQKIELDKSRTEQPPVVVQVFSSPSASKESGEGERERDEKNRTDWLMIILTGILAFIGFLQLIVFGIQARRLRQSVDEMKIATKATERTAEASQLQALSIINAERAYLFVEVLIDEQLHSSPGGINNKIRTKIWNNGKTPAEIIQIRVTSFPLAETPQELIEFPGSERLLPPGLGIAKNCSHDIETVCNINDKDFGEIQRLEKTLFCFGNIKYRDIFDHEHETGFCWRYRYHMQEGRFFIDSNSKLNKRV